MLLRFAVANHLSFRRRQELSFVASSLKDSGEGPIDCPASPSGKLLPAAAIYGANASGKTNLVRALKAMRDMVVASAGDDAAGGRVLEAPFGLDSSAMTEPSTFEVDLSLDGVRLHYGFQTRYGKFDREWLHDFPRSRRRKLFDRTGNEFKVGRGLKGINRSMLGSTKSNVLLMPRAASRGHEALGKLCDYFKKMTVIEYKPPSNDTIVWNLGDDHRRFLALDLLKDAATGVRGWVDRSIHDPGNEQREGFYPAPRRLSEPFPPEARNDDADRGYLLASPRLVHRGAPGEGGGLDLDSESAGTRRLLEIAGAIYGPLRLDGTLVAIDELDASLHTAACEAVLKRFAAREINRKGAQLIATVHDTNIMKSSALRRDQIWFVEKDETGASELYPLTDFRTRRGDDIEKGYSEGRYGAFPAPSFPIEP